ncbi:MAG: extracellular solute-binding protein [Candidatus Hydrothermae bacterium]|nr:extracellular solute-binding protein [Candidatus Hydrothermae bacterium]
MSHLFVMMLFLKLLVYHAGSLSFPFSIIEKEFEREKGIQVERISGGSRYLVKRITELGLEPDVIAVADYKLLYKLMPEYIDSFFLFARNEMVIAYTDKSKYSDEINSDNWYEILSRRGVRVGRADPKLDPCGYRALMVLQLAERFYKKSGIYDKILKNSGDRFVRPKSVELLALLEVGEIDYAFEYLSVAKQHKLKYITLPPEINLSQYSFEEFYNKAMVVVENDTLKGEPILYGIALLNNSRNRDEAVAFLKFLFEKGKKILYDSGQPPLSEVVILR